MNGIERKTLTKKAKIWLINLFSNNCPFFVKNKKIPIGSPSKKPKNPETNVIKTVSQVPLSNRLITASDITDFF